MLLEISKSNCNGIYNIANGLNLSNQELLDIISQFYDFQYTLDLNSKLIIHPKIKIDKIEKEFSFQKENTKEKLFNLIKNYKNDTSR